MHRRKHFHSPLNLDTQYRAFDTEKTNSYPSKHLIDEKNQTELFLVVSWLLQLYNLITYPHLSIDRSSTHYMYHEMDKFHPEIIGLLSILVFLYALDWIGHRSLLLISIWVLGVGVSSAIFLCTYYHRNSTIYNNHHIPSSFGIIFSTLGHTFIDTSIWICLACWACLHFQWKRMGNEQHNEHHSQVSLDQDLEEWKDASQVRHGLTTPFIFQGLLYTVLPFGFACTGTRRFFQWLLYIHGAPGDSALDIQYRIFTMNRLELWLVSFIFWISWTLARCYCTPRESSLWLGLFDRLRWIIPSVLYIFLQSFLDKGGNQQEEKWWLDALEKYSVERHSKFYGILSVPSFLWDIILLLTVPVFLDPYIASCRLKVHRSSLRPYVSKRVQFVMGCLAFVAMEFRILFPCTLYTAHAIHGNVVVQPLWLTTVYLATSMLCFGISIWFYGRTSNGEYIGGDYHDDIFQALVISSTMSAAMACALPFKAFPFVFVATLSFSLFLSTNMARFMLLFILTVISLAYASTFYRYYHIRRDVDIIPGFLSVTLHQLSLLIIAHGAAWGILAAMIGRSSHRFGEQFKLKYDLTGIILAIATFLLFFVEVSLMTNDVGLLSRDIYQHEVRVVYHPALAITTSLVIAFFGCSLSSQKQIKPIGYLITTSLCISKASSVVVLLIMDMNPSKLGKELQWNILRQTSILFVAAIVIRTPFVLLLPGSLHRYRGRLRWAIKSDLPYHDHGPLERGASFLTTWSFIYVHMFLLLPTTLLFSIHSFSSVFTSWNGKFSASRMTTYFSFTCIFWSVIILQAMNHLVHSNDLESLRRYPALVFTFGCILLLLMPSEVSFSYGGYNSLNSIMGADSSPRSEFGGLYGLLIVGLAILLVLTGLLNISAGSGRPMASQALFSFVLGLGISCFVTQQIMWEEAFFLRALTFSALSLMTFLGSWMILWGYVISSDLFQYVITVFRSFLYSWALILFLPTLWNICNRSLWVHKDWSYYCQLLSGIIFASFTMALRSRKDRTFESKAIGNASTLLIWGSSIMSIYLQHGIVSMSGPPLSVEYILGVTPSILWTILSSCVLLLLDSKSVSESARRHTQYQNILNWIGRDIYSLQSVPLVASVAVFIMAVFYVLFFRGCPLDMNKFHGYEAIISTFQAIGEDTTSSFEEVVSTLYSHMNHHNVIIVASKLAGSGFWTSEYLYGPFLHLFGVILILPFWIHYAKYTLDGKRQTSSFITLCVSLCAFPLLFCYGIPHLRAASFLGLVVGVVHAMNMNRIQWAERMQL